MRATLKMAAVAPMPRASVSAATNVKPGVRASVRSADQVLHAALRRVRAGAKKFAASKIY